MRMISCCLLIAHLAAGVAHAQTANDLQVQLGAYNLRPDGGDRPLGIWFTTGPVAIGKRVTSTFSIGDTCEAFSVSSDGSLREKATAAWRIDVTPTRVVRDAVTFRLRWQMAGLGQAGLQFSDGPAIRGDIELTLRPGESWPVYTLRNISGYSCPSTSSIRVSVDNYPSEGDEHRLVAADLWLIERLSNGTEVQRSQPLSVRGLPNRPSHFYFDSLVDGSVTLDIYGTLMSHLGTDAIAMSVETRSRWAPESRNFSGPQRSVTSDIQVKPAETVEIRLPLLGDEAGTFAKRALSIRIRARQLR